MVIDGVWVGVVAHGTSIHDTYSRRRVYRVANYVIPIELQLHNGLENLIGNHPMFACCFSITLSVLLIPRQIKKLARP